ncbi:retrovirus-related Pol polyprotein from transposon 297 [Trichonephila clavipes]|nr:retrovirus-related Pol polyprotein from transposon 297 [Trichonephila clavipes]
MGAVQCSGNDITDIIKEIKKAQILSQETEKKQISSRAPWWTAACGHLRAKKRKLLNKARKNFKEEDWIKYKEGQSIETYVTQLKTLASTCKFAEQENGLIQERLLRENNLNVEKSIEIIRAAKASREQVRNMKYDTATISFVKENENKPKTQYNCKKCGRKHKPRECPAFGKICAPCTKKNHFSAKCFQSTKNVPENELVYIDSVNENGIKCAMKNSTNSNFKNVEMVSETTWYKNASLDVNNKCFDVNFKLGTGAEVNILPLYILSMFKVNPKLSKTNISITTYVNVKSKPILGLRGCKESGPALGVGKPGPSPGRQP